jgi:hypothetical protein
MDAVSFKAVIVAAALAAVSAGCCRPWACGGACGRGPWWTALAALGEWRGQLVPHVEPEPPHPKFHPAPTDNVFAPRGDTLPSKRATPPGLRMRSLVPGWQLPYVPPADRRIAPPQPPPEVLPAPNSGEPASPSREA